MEKGMCSIPNILPVSALFKTIIDIQISHFFGVRSSKSYFRQLSDHLRSSTIKRGVEIVRYTASQEVD